jgi:hypothetical protein
VATLTTAQLAALERLRGGEPMRVRLTAHARAHANGSLVEGRMAEEQAFSIDRDEWLGQLKAAAFADTLIVEIPVPDPRSAPPLAEATGLLRQALDHSAHGRPAEAVGGCRVAVEALGNAGFGRHAPENVVHFIKENARRLSMDQRYSVLRAAVELYCSPPHHPGAHDVGPADAAFATAVTAALLALAPLRGKPPS